MSSPTPPDDIKAQTAKATNAPSATADFIMGTVILFAAVVMFYLTLSWRPSAAIFPRIVAGLLAILGAIQIFQAAKRRNEINQEAFIADKAGFLKIWIAIPLYFVSIKIIGFPLASVLLIVGMSRAFGYKKIKLSLLAGIIFVTVILIVFTGLFDRPLPNGLILDSILNS